MKGGFILKRMLSLLLCVIMVLGVLPPTVLAAPEDYFVFDAATQTITAYSQAAAPAAVSQTDANTPISRTALPPFLKSTGLA